MARRLFRSNAEIARDAQGTDSGKMVLGLGLLGVAAWLGWTYVIKPGRAAAAQPGTTPVQPGPGPGNLPGPTPVAPPPGGSVGDSAQQGDTILVSTSKLSGLPGGVPPTIEMTVTAAVAGSPVIIAQATGRAGDQVPAGFGLPVPRSEITSVTRGGGGQITPPQPGNLPGPIPGLPNVVPPVIGPVDLGNPMPMVQGLHYRARLELDPTQAGAVNFLGTGPIVTQLQQAGFSDVQVFKPTDALPGDWPQSTVKPIASNIYYAQGTWTEPSGPVPRPPGVAMAWVQ
jgi:hypothetical protein